MAENLANLATLFADVVGSTHLYETLGDARALAAIDTCLGALAETVDEFGGRTVKTIGDELMAVFPTAAAAREAAIEMQWRVTELPAVEGHRIAVRIGFHFGPAVERDGDVFGDSVNVAARLSALAKGDQIITSERTLEALPEAFASRARLLSQLGLRGKSEEIAVYEILWRESEDVTVMMSAQLAMPSAPTHLRLLYQGTELMIGAERPTATLGRDPKSDLAVADKNASRTHARIEWRRDKFVLVDQSTNGTFVAVEGAPDIKLHLEEMVLHGSGVIFFGRARSGERAARIEYYCENLRRLKG